MQNIAAFLFYLYASRIVLEIKKKQHTGSVQD